MSKELAVELVKQGGSLLGALLWASLALCVVLLFRKQIIALLEGQNLSFEGLGVKVAVSRAATAGALVQAAEAKAQVAVTLPPPPGPLRAPPPASPATGAGDGLGFGPPPFTPEPKSESPSLWEAPKVFGAAPGPAAPYAAAPPPSPAQPSASVTPQALDVLLDRNRARAISRKRILWVDDNPADVANEAGAFRELGIQVDHATDTDSALTRLQSGRYDLVISDLARGGENEAGLILMRTMRADNIDTPVVIYTSAHAARLTQGAKAAGAILVTSSPTVLFETVVRRLAA